MDIPGAAYCNTCSNVLTKCANHSHYCWHCDRQCPWCYNEKIGWRVWKSKKDTTSHKLEGIRLEHEDAAKRPLSEGDYSLSFEMELNNLRIYDGKGIMLMKVSAASKEAFWEGPNGHFDVETGNEANVLPEFVPNPWYSNSSRTFEQWLSFVPSTLCLLYELTKGGKQRVKLKHLYGVHGKGEDTSFTLCLADPHRPARVESGVQPNFSISLEVLGKYALKGLDPFAAFAPRTGVAFEKKAKALRKHLCAELARWTRDRNITVNPSKDALTAVGFWWCSLYFLCMECSPSERGEAAKTKWKFRYDFLPRVSLYQLVCTGLNDRARAIARSMFQPACDAFRAWIDREGARFPKWDFIDVRAEAVSYDLSKGFDIKCCKSQRYAFVPAHPYDDPTFPAAASASFVLELLEAGLSGNLRLEHPWRGVSAADLRVITAPTRTKLFDCIPEKGLRVIIECRCEQLIGGTREEVEAQLTALKNFVEQMAKGPPP